MISSARNHIVSANREIFRVDRSGDLHTAFGN